MNGKTLTAEQCSKLSLYILMTTKTREGVACIIYRALEAAGALGNLSDV